MSYDSTITFTLDTICPWTYLAFLRLSKALASHRAAHASSPVTFTLRIAPYQLYPDFCTPVDRYDWYRDVKYDGNAARVDKYAAYMAALGRNEGVEFDFSSGPFANTFQAHRVLGWVQEHSGPGAAVEALRCLYELYFEQRAHPSSPETLLKACKAAGLDEKEAKSVVEDESEAAAETKMAIREQAGNGVDSVPYIVFEGKRRDFTLIGAKEVGEYIKTLEQVVKEAS